MSKKLINNIINSHWRSLLSFLTVGALSALLNFSLFSLFWGLLKLNYQLAISIAYILSVLFHFTANRHFTFKSTQTHLTPQIAKYLVMVSINYLLTMAVMYYVVETLSFSPYFGTIAAIGATVGISYLLARLWVFRPKTLDTLQGD